MGCYAHDFAGSYRQVAVSYHPLLVQLLATSDNKLGPVNAEKAFAAIHQSLGKSQSFELQFAVNEGLSGMFLQFDKRMASTILDPFQANYPHVQQAPVDAKKLQPPDEYKIWVAELELQRELFALRSYRDFEDLLDRNLNDPVSGLMKLLHVGNSTRVHAQIQIRLQTASRSHVLIARRAILRLMNPFFHQHQWLKDWFSVWRVHRSWWRR